MLNNDNTCAGTDPNPRPPKELPPPGACDCHAHIFGPVDQFPYSHTRKYTPPEASLEAYRHMLATLGLARGVIVQPGVYGFDNRATLDAIKGAGGENPSQNFGRQPRQPLWFFGNWHTGIDFFASPGNNLRAAAYVEYDDLSCNL